jgi:hypothetical protein
MKYIRDVQPNKFPLNQIEFCTIDKLCFIRPEGSKCVCSL